MDYGLEFGSLRRLNPKSDITPFLFFSSRYLFDEETRSECHRLRMKKRKELLATILESNRSESSCHKSIFSH
jgi:hypothetical protein